MKKANKTMLTLSQSRFCRCNEKHENTSLLFGFSSSLGHMYKRNERNNQLLYKKSTQGFVKRRKIVFIVQVNSANKVTADIQYTVNT